MPTIDVLVLVTGTHANNRYACTSDREHMPAIDMLVLVAFPIINMSASIVPSE